MGRLDGVTTFCDMSLPLAATLAQALHMPGNTAHAVTAARDKVGGWRAGGPGVLRVLDGRREECQQLALCLVSCAPATCTTLAPPPVCLLPFRPRSTPRAASWARPAWQRRAAPASSVPRTWRWQPSLLASRQCSSPWRARPALASSAWTTASSWQLPTHASWPTWPQQRCATPPPARAVLCWSLIAGHLLGGLPRCLAPCS